MQKIEPWSFQIIRPVALYLPQRVEGEDTSRLLPGILLRIERERAH